MQKFITMLLALIAATMFAMMSVSCRDDDDDDDGSSDGDTDTDSDGDADGDGDADQDPFAGLDCSTTDAATCDFNACAQKQLYDALKSACDSASTTADWEAYCDDSVACYSKFIKCFTDACPAGGTYADADANVLSTCNTDFQSCTSGLTQPTTK